jgi:CBS domain containing-hemolysin-like protein
MPIYLQIVLLVATFIVFVFAAMYFAGLGLRRVCFKMIAEMEEAGAFKASKAIKLQDERKNFFHVGTGNLRPRALHLLISDKLVIKTPDGKYYLDKEKLAEMRSKLGR